MAGISIPRPKICAELLARLKVLQRIFDEQYELVPLYSYNASSYNAAPLKKMKSKLSSLVKKEKDSEGEGDSGEGGGSMKGLRVEQNPRETPRLKAF
jgi:hypothetical protein